MARQPENRRNRGRRSEVSLDWLTPDPKPTADPAAPRASPQSERKTLGRRAAREQRDTESRLEAPWDDVKATKTEPPGPSGGRRRRDRSPEPAPEPVNRPRRWRVAFWLTLAALLLTLWSATAFVDSGNFVLAGLACLSPVVTVIAVPVIAIGVASKHLVPTVIAVIAALLPWTLVPGYLSAGPGSTTIGANSTLRVMSVDGAQGLASARDIVQVARIYSVNIVVVTQLSTELAHQLTVQGLDVLGTAQWVKVPITGTSGTGVWSGQRIENLQEIDDLGRPGVSGTIDAGAAKIGITVVQLKGEPFHRSASWHRDLLRLADRPAPSMPSFLVGDLNASPWQPAFRKLTDSGWRDAADVVGQGLRPTWPSWSPVPIAPLDHVLVNPGLGVNSADTVNIAGSDHRALIVTLILPKSASAISPDVTGSTS